MNTLASSIIARTDAMRGTTPANGAPEKRIVRVGSLARYKAAIADLKTQLGLPDVWVVIASAEFCSIHGIASCFLFVLAKAGIIKRRRHKRAGWQYQGTTKLMHLTPEVAQGLIRGLRKEVVPPAPEVIPAPVAEPTAQAEKPECYHVYVMCGNRDGTQARTRLFEKDYPTSDEAIAELETAIKQQPLDVDVSGYVVKVIARIEREVVVNRITF